MAWVTAVGMRNQAICPKGVMPTRQKETHSHGLVQLRAPGHWATILSCEPHRWSAWGRGEYGELSRYYWAFRGLGVGLFKSQSFCVKESREEDIDH